ncbi:toll/interleukin-1 receptor domain-containing protein [Candidatus Protofrankia californiensis]|uniref:toll/interleukin-1 receptor domain-containing protein n=1 Tax=Candidatus Protofrankia californiensis TaxID=1839754 RepID=UPI0010412610|nr:toll/interleukin-1 receptor domain-containing protein [Candidatus Protofrankia californiensis]
MTNGGNPSTGSTDRTGWDFFVSYTQTDQAWAAWIAWQLEEAGGFRVLLQAWDMVPGTNFVVGMQNGVTRAQHTIAVLSDAYARSLFGAAEWQAAFSADPDGFQRKLLVVRVEDCARPGLLGQVVSFDLFSVPEDEARDELVKWARLAATGGRAKPADPPTFPGGSPAAANAAPASPTGAGAGAAMSPSTSGAQSVGGIRIGDVSAPGGGIAVGVNYGQISQQRHDKQQTVQPDGAPGGTKQGGTGSS